MFLDFCRRNNKQGMASIQIIGIIVVALLGLYIFYSLYDIWKFDRKQREKDARKNKTNNK